MRKIGAQLERKISRTIYILAIFTIYSVLCTINTILCVFSVPFSSVHSSFWAANVSINPTAFPTATDCLCFSIFECMNTEHQTLVHKYSSIPFNSTFNLVACSLYFRHKFIRTKVCATMFYLSFRNKILTKLNSNAILKAIETEKRMQREVEWKKERSRKTLFHCLFCSCWIKANYANGEDCFIRANLLFAIYYIFSCTPILFCVSSAGSSVTPCHAIPFCFVSFRSVLSRCENFKVESKVTKIAADCVYLTKNRRKRRTQKVK